MLITNLFLTIFGIGKLEMISLNLNAIIDNLKRENASYNLTPGLSGVIECETRETLILNM